MNANADQATLSGSKKTTSEPQRRAVARVFAKQLGRMLISLLGDKIAQSFLESHFEDSEISIKGRRLIIDNEKVSALSREFSEALAEKLTHDFGFDFTERFFQEAFEKTERLAESDKNNNKFVILTLVPENVLMAEKAKVLSRPELEQKVLERTKKLEELNAHLEDLVEERTRDLAKANQKLEEVNVELSRVDNARKQFLSLASHQIRTTLTAIKWALSALQEKDDFNKLGDRERELVNDAYANNERMIRLVNNLLNQARIEDGRFTYDFRKMDARDIIKSVCTAFAYVARTNGVRLEYNLPKKDVCLKADREKFQLVLENLVDNAIKYSKGKGDVSVDLLTEGAVLRIKIQDSGIGIPKAEQESIFDQFSRGSNTDGLEGSGLGLYLAKQIVEDHGGNIWFDTKENKGTTFYTEVPLYESK